MEAVREKWTDERLDDMNGRMGEGFDRLDKDLREVRSEIGGVREEINGLRGEMKTFGKELRGETQALEVGLRGETNELRVEMNTRFEAMHRLIIQVGGGLFGTMVVGFLSLVLTQH
jgi:archaellum component FlaC